MKSYDLFFLSDVKRKKKMESPITHEKPKVIEIIRWIEQAKHVSGLEYGNKNIIEIIIYLVMNVYPG